MADLPPRWGRRSPPGRGSRVMETPGAEAALEAVMVGEGRLHRVEGVLRQALDRTDRDPVALDGEQQAGSHRVAAEQDRARPTTPCSQPRWVPVRPNSWRRKSDSRRRGSTSRSSLRPLICTVILMPRSSRVRRGELGRAPAPCVAPVDVLARRARGLAEPSSGAGTARPEQRPASCVPGATGRPRRAAAGEVRRACRACSANPVRALGGSGGTSIYARAARRAPAR